MDSKYYYVFPCLLTTDHLVNTIELENNKDKAKRLLSDFWFELDTTIFEEIFELVVLPCPNL